jgi:hypothetical protein
MSRKFGIVMICVWSVVALALIGLLVTLICLRGTSGRGGFNLWSWSAHPDSAQATQYADKSFPAAGINEISVNSTNADISFSQSSDKKIKVDITGVGGPKDKQAYTVAQSGSTLRITQNAKWWNFSLSLVNNQRIAITLPKSYSNALTLNSTSGDITFKGGYAFSNASIYKTSGDLNGDAVKAGSFLLKTTSGDLNLSELDADYEIHSTSGDMQISRLDGHGSISNISGDGTFGVQKLTGALSISSTSGDYQLKLAKSVGARITAHTASGEVNAGFPMRYSGDDRHGATDLFGRSPYNNIDVSLLSGDVSFS